MAESIPRRRPEDRGRDGRSDFEFRAQGITNAKGCLSVKSRQCFRKLLQGAGGRAIKGVGKGGIVYEERPVHSRI